MSDPAAVTYFQMDEVKENIQESDETPNEARLQNWGDASDREIDQALRYLLGPEFVFPMDEAKMIAAGFTSEDFNTIKKISNALTEGRFWLNTNSEKAVLEDARTQLESFVEHLTEIPATTE